MLFHERPSMGCKSPEPPWQGAAFPGNVKRCGKVLLYNNIFEHGEYREQ